MRLGLREQALGFLESTLTAAQIREAHDALGRLGRAGGGQVPAGQEQPLLLFELSEFKNQLQAYDWRNRSIREFDLNAPQYFNIEHERFEMFPERLLYFAEKYWALCPGLRPARVPWPRRRRRSRSRRSSPSAAPVWVISLHLRVTSAAQRPNLLFKVP